MAPAGTAGNRDHQSRSTRNPDDGVTAAARHGPAAADAIPSAPPTATTAVGDLLEPFGPSLFDRDRQTDRICDGEAPDDCAVSGKIAATAARLGKSLRMMFSFETRPSVPKHEHADGSGRAEWNLGRACSSLRLVARIADFQSAEDGSKPSGSAISPVV